MKATIQKIIEEKKVKSAWNKGVKNFALELLESLETYNPETLKTDLLNGASDWQQFSYGGCFYVYDEDIAKALCTPSELIKTKNGEKQPNLQETWLDVQARALYQASLMICKASKQAQKQADK